MSKAKSPLEYYLSLLDMQIKAGLVPAAERSIRRRSAETTFGLAMQTLAILQISWIEAATQYRDALECHANARHDIPFAPSVITHRNPADTGTIAHERCERCDTVRLRTHFDGEPWFSPSGSPRYEHSEAYELNGHRSEPSAADYKALFAAIQLTERALRRLESLKG